MRRQRNCQTICNCRRQAGTYQCEPLTRRNEFSRMERRGIETLVKPVFVRLFVETMGLMGAIFGLIAGLYLDVVGDESIRTGRLVEFARGRPR